MQAVITCYYNPSQNPYRLDAYRIFRDGIFRAKVPLYCIELAFGADKFHLNHGDADRLTQIRCKDVMFQKERCLNLLLEQLPDKVKEVIWMDCDLVYFEDDWPERVSKALEDHPVIQPYAYSVALPQSKVARVDEFHTIYHECYRSGVIRRSYAYWEAKRKGGPNFHHGHVGYVWAGRRGFLDKHKFYDPIISGAGDLFMVMAFTGNFGWLEMPDQLRRYPLKSAFHFFDWGFPVYRDTRGEVGHTSDMIMHVWHGEVQNRNYLDVSRYLQLCDFDPQTDIAIDENGCWMWASDKPKLHQAMCRTLISEQWD